LSQYFEYDINTYISAQLEPIGVTAADFDRTGVWTNRTGRNYGATRVPGFRFRTPSGKIELANERFRRNGFDALPRYTAPAQPPGEKLRLLPGKQAFFTHATNQNNEWLNELCPENRLWINRAEASRRGIRDNDLVVVRSGVGEVTVRAMVTDRIRPDCVHLPHGWGHRSAGLRVAGGRGASDQDLIESKWDRISGNAALHETFVSVERI
jgi:thiosulfate reductase/polysulfide reductase chain A